MTLGHLVPFRRQLRNRQDVPARRSDYPLIQLQQEMNSLFDGFFPEFFNRSLNDFGFASSDWNFNPQLDIKETKKEIQVTAELPGVDKEDIDIRLDQNMLTIRGEKRAEKSDEKEGWRHNECCYGSFVRTVPLDAEVDADGIEARFKNGVLKITLPKAHPSEPDAKRIEVTAG